MNFVKFLEHPQKALTDAKLFSRILCASFEEEKFRFDRSKEDEEKSVGNQKTKERWKRGIYCPSRWREMVRVQFYAWAKWKYKKKFRVMATGNDHSRGYLWAKVCTLILTNIPFVLTLFRTPKAVKYLRAESSTEAALLTVKRIVNFNDGDEWKAVKRLWRSGVR